MINKTKCRFCGSKETKKDGVRSTNNRGKIQRFRCKKCNKRFVQKDAFFRMRNAPNKITLCMDLYYKGVSFRKIKQLPEEKERALETQEARIILTALNLA